MTTFTPWSIYPAETVVGTHWIGDTVDPRTDLGAVEKGKDFGSGQPNSSLSAILFIYVSY
jgi:hypothetical protein